MDKKLQVHVQDPGVYCGSFGDLIFGINGGAMTPAHLDRLQKAFDSVSRGSPTGKLVNVVILKMNVASTNKDARERLNEFMKRNRDITTASAVVVSGTSVVSGVVRAAVTAIFLVSRGTYPKKIFATTAEAVTWAYQYSAESWTATERADCARQIIQLEQKYDQRVAA